MKVVNTHSTAAAVAAVAPRHLTTKLAKGALYTPEERRRRDASKWTIVQGVLAPIQFLVMAISVALVLRYLRTGDGLAAANISVIVKTFVLYTIMVTGAIWEKEVFGQYLFARPFFWEDVVSFGVIALHTAYLAGLALEWPPRSLLVLALVAYATYAVNAVQFILKLRAARLSERTATASSSVDSTSLEATA